MGGSHHTNKSLEDVKSDLLSELIYNARTLLKKDFNVQSTDNNLETLLSNIATRHFQDTFNYEYNDDRSQVTPPKSLGDIRSASRICSIVPPIGAQVTDYLKTGVFSKLDLPPWMEKTAINDLSNIANTIASADTGKQWKYNEYRRTYDARKDDQDNFTCNSVMVYCNGSLVEDGTQAQLAVIYYCGVYYKTVSETKATRDNMETAAYNSLVKLAGGSPPTDTQSLKTALDGYAKGRFESEFSFKYGDAPSDSLQAQGVSSAFLVKNSQVDYIPDTKTDDLQNFIQHQIYDGINIPLPSIETAAIKDTFDQFKSILNNASVQSWNVTRLYKDYQTRNPENNPVRQAGIIMSWYDHKTTDGQVPVSVTFIYIMTMFYELDSAEHTLARELYHTLCNNLRVHIHGADGTGPSDAEALKKFMEDYSKQQFRDSFDYDWQDKETKPPNTKKTKVNPDGRFTPFHKVLMLDTYPVNQKDVEEWMNSDLFRKDDPKDRTYPPWAVGQLYDDIVSHVMRACGPKSVKDNNWWYTEDFNRKYYDPNESSKTALQQFGFFLYALGDMTLDKISKDGQEGVSMKRMFVYYIGIISSYDPDSEGEW
ncbi:hypothetical protein P691DRAFT_773711 [Macrolepiota fuliginosa MF-IS2]|uniref:Uncharacterized protein n=1 Tax=Macrolepiota fuliginosa MF-IS2 TaxID=1400762 RepID=A0A9P6C6V7_9AGAR|nr:hypothetical protein P691DRAFT_773711 [Macrolepiota fuliginosa MF-IS2]